MKARKLLLLVVMCLTTFMTGFANTYRPSLRGKAYVDLDCGIYDITAESNGSATYAGQMEIQ